MTKNKKQPRTAPESSRSAAGLLTLAGLMILGWVHAGHWKFIQDDAFITFRYIRNFIAGNGLVWNIGERVEGYTTFLWTVLLALPATMGFDLIPASQYLGSLLGIATLYCIFRLAGELTSSPRPRIFSLIAPLLFAANSAAAYWNISGMETGLFTFLTTLAVWFYLKERKREHTFGYAPFVFALLSFTRPEGMFLFMLSMTHYAYEVFTGRKEARRAGIRKLLLWSAMYAVPIGIFMIWRFSYYGYFFPNTYYAKAGISKEYFTAGVEYLQNFAVHYLFYGALLIFPVVAMMKRIRSGEMLYLAFIATAYTGYIVLVGGDVLPAFRFFIPVLPLIYLLVQEGIGEVYGYLERKRSMVKPVMFALPLALAYYTYDLPYDYIRRYWELENGLVSKMTAQGLWIKAHSTPNTVIAASTIGAIGYYSEVTLIDMLGLTDETIAHHPEQNFGVKSGWKERNYNATYVLSRKPDWICFSTGFKPSAFAERALFLKKEFRQRYYPYYFHPSGNREEIGIVYKRGDQTIEELTSVVLPEDSVQSAFINDYYDGVNRISRWPKDALEYFQKAEATAPADFALLYEGIAGAYRSLQNSPEALKAYERAVIIDPRMVESRTILGYYALQQQNPALARTHFEALTRFDPDYSVGWTFLGEARRMSGDLDGARAAFVQALKITPNDQDAASALRQLSAPR